MQPLGVPPISSSSRTQCGNDEGKLCIAVPNTQPSGAWHKKRLEAKICPVAKILNKYGLRTEESHMQNDATIPLYLST